MAQNTECVERNLLRETPYAKTLMAVSCVRNGAMKTGWSGFWYAAPDLRRFASSGGANGQMRAKPPEMPEDDLLELLEKGFRAGVFTRDFTVRLREMLDRILIERRRGREGAGRARYCGTDFPCSTTKTMRS